MDPLVTLVLFGPNAPFFVFTDQFGSADRTTRMVVSTVLLVAQNGQVAEVREDIEVISISADTPVHASGSFAGSLPEYAKVHLSAFKSTVMYRSTPGQFES